MKLKTVCQVLFYMQVVRISAIGSDDSQRRALMILSNLENKENLPGELDTFKTDIFDRPESDYPDYMKGTVTLGSMFDVLHALFGKGNSIYNKFMDSKPKRGWEDLNLAWRRSHKRAWEVVNRLWRRPDIRRRYKNFLKNGKRSEEVVEDIPVQQDNKNPTWMIDEIGYVIDSSKPDIENGPRDNDIWHINDLKRGWEDVGRFRRQRFNLRRLLSGKRSYTDTIDKRGWENIAWKRDNGGISKDMSEALQKGTFDDTSSFDYNMIPISNEDTNNHIVQNLTPDIIHIVDQLGSGKETNFDKQWKSTSDGLLGETDVFENNYDKTNFPDDLNKFEKEYEDAAQTEWNKDEFPKRSSYSVLCHLMFGRISSCSDKAAKQSFSEENIMYG